MKKITIIFALLLLSLAASADIYQDPETKVNYEYTPGQSEASVAKSSEASGDITILSSFTADGNSYTVTSIGGYAFWYCSGLTSVTIPNSVTSIGEWSFGGCSGLTSITIPNSVTSIGGEAFMGCSGLTTVAIPNSVTSIGRNAFSGCSGLTSITIGNSVTSIGDGAFGGCSGLTSIVVESGNTVYDSRNNCNAIITTETNELIAGCKTTTIPNSVTSIGNQAFWYCSSLTSVTIPNSVTSIGYGAFYHCSGLTSISIPNSVTFIDEDAFRSCSGLTEVRSMITEPFAISTYCWYDVNKDIPLYVPYGMKEKYKATAGWKEFTNIIEMEYEGPTGNIAFADANVKAICVAKWDADGDGELSYKEAVVVTDLGEYFKENENITSFDELQYFTRLTSIGDYAFYKCSGLTSVTIPNSVTSIGKYTFGYCSGLTSVTIPESVTSIGSGAFWACSGLPSVTIPNSVTSIGQSTFWACSGLTSVTIPKFVTSIGDEAFRHCSGLTSVTIPNSVTSIGECAFENCSGLTSATIGNSVTSIGRYAFANCSGLTSVTIPSSVTSIGYAAFRYCIGLTSIDIPNSVTELNGTFSGCSGLTSVTIPESVTSIGEFAFANCSGLTSVTIPNSVTSIGENAFQGCSGLTSVTIPSSMTSIGGWAFYGCSGLTSITIPNSVTSIGDGAFDGCSGLTSVTIGNSVTSIGNKAFWYCSSLTSVTIPNSVTSIRGNAFRYCSSLTEIKVEEGNTVYDSRNNSNAIIKTETNELIVGCMNTVIPNSVMSIGDNAFEGSIGLTSITIPKSVTSIGIGAFSGCNGLTELKVEGGNTVYDSRNNCNAVIETETNELIVGCKSTVIPNSVTSIGEEAFGDCIGLTSVTIPNSVTSIGDYAFYKCSGLTSVTIGNSVTSIGEDAFWYCSSLTEVRSMITEPFAISKSCWYGANKDIPLYVPIGTKALYEATAGWNYFTNIVETDGLEADDDGEKDFGEDGDITEDTDLSGVVVDNMFYNIGTDAGGYNSEEGCIVITKETSDEQMELLQGLGISDEELQKNFTGIIFKVPAGEGTVKVTAETTGNMTLKVKVGNGKAMKMELSGKLKMEFPYDVNEESLVYIFAGTTDESGIRGAAASEPSSLKIYGIEWSSSSPKGDVNGDGKVNVGDIMAVINVMAGVGGEVEKAAADINGDGAVNVGDIMAVINIMAGK